MFDDLVGTKLDPQTQLDWVYQLMREMSLQTNPQEMVRAYSQRMGEYLQVSGSLSLSRRGLEYPMYRITRYTGWQETINPWKQKDQLPLLKGGLLAELIYNDAPIIIDDLDIEPEDPAATYLRGQKSLLVIPMLDNGVALNMVLLMREETHGFRPEDLPSNFWLANLFGRATSNLVLKSQVDEAYESLDRENRVVGEIQRSLLPSKMPTIPGLKLAASYETSQRAGGDYYDFFALSNGKWGILIADVSGHGPPAAVVMAITHSIAHLFPNQSDNPADLLTFVNRHLSKNYMSGIEAFVTAFYAIYDAQRNELTYSSAGHNPPILVDGRSGECTELDDAVSFPLGVDADADYESTKRSLGSNDCLVLYTDGITEAEGQNGELFGTDRLMPLAKRSQSLEPESLVRLIIDSVDQFSEHRAPSDDRTLVVAQFA